MGPGVLACANEDHGEVIIEHILRGFWDRSGLVERVGHNTGQGCRVQVRSDQVRKTICICSSYSS